MGTIKRILHGANIPAYIKERKALASSKRSALRLEGQAGITRPFTARGLMGSFKEGGVVKKTGIYKLHKNEKVIPAKKKG